MAGRKTTQPLDRMATGDAARQLGVCTKTLRNWRDRGLIEATKTRSGRLMWNVAAYLKAEQGVLT